MSMCLIKFRVPLCFFDIVVDVFGTLQKPVQKAASYKVPNLGDNN